MAPTITAVSVFKHLRSGPYLELSRGGSGYEGVVMDFWVVSTDYEISTERKVGVTKNQ